MTKSRSSVAVSKPIARKSEASIRGIILARDGKLHISALMLLRIVDYLTVADDRPNIGEIHGFYAEQRLSTEDAINYTYSGVASMLRAMHKRKYLNRHRSGRLITYSLTKKGEGTLDSMYM